MHNPVVDQVDGDQDSSDDAPVVPGLQKTPMVSNIPKLNLPITRGGPPQVPKLLPLVKPEPLQQTAQDVIRSIYDSDQSQSGLMRIGEIHEKLITGRISSNKVRDSCTVK